MPTETIQQAYFRLQNCDDFSFSDPDAKASKVQVLADLYARKVSTGNSHYDAISTNGFIHGFSGHTHVDLRRASREYKSAYKAGQEAA